MATLAAHGRAVRVARLDGGIEVVDAVAAEHVSLQCAEAAALAEPVRNAGAIFIGPWSPIAAGDYATGTNHVLPTGGAARAWSGIGVESFGRWIEMQRLTPAGVAAWRQPWLPSRPPRACRLTLPAYAPGPAGRPRRQWRTIRIDLLRRPEPVAALPRRAVGRGARRPRRRCR